MPVVQIEHDPQAAADHHQDQESGEKERHQILARRALEIDVQEKSKLHDDLGDRRDGNHRERWNRRQQRPVNDRERDHRQHERRAKTGQVGPSIRHRNHRLAGHDHSTPGR